MRVLWLVHSPQSADRPLCVSASVALLPRLRSRGIEVVQQEVMTEPTDYCDYDVAVILVESFSSEQWTELLAIPLPKMFWLFDRSGVEALSSLATAAKCSAMFVNSLWLAHEATRLGLPERSDVSYLPVPLETGENSAQRSPGKKRVIIRGAPAAESRILQVLEVLCLVPNPLDVIWLVSEHEQERANLLIDAFPEKTFRLVAGQSLERWCELLATADVAIDMQTSFARDLEAFHFAAIRQRCPLIAQKLPRGLLRPSELASSCFNEVPLGASEIPTLRKVLDFCLTTRSETVDAVDGNRDCAHWVSEVSNPERIADEFMLALERVMLRQSRQVLETGESVFL